ncbi:hypothetical protein [Hyphomicrobium sp. 99]|uniref:hypothetical protein n=1 Tax=Hyphomicrobium sp. 99 TaxID=1163419 RepID=UPI0005F828A2|nr:hypothetical protein [Hyphomicrobium sp. 99]
MFTRAFAVFIAGISISSVVSVAAADADAISDESAGSIEQLMTAGWQIAGYASNSDNRSTFILFKKPNENYLVQCLAGYDVTRSPRVFHNCYRLR